MPGAEGTRAGSGILGCAGAPRTAPGITRTAMGRPDRAGPSGVRLPRRLKHSPKGTFPKAEDGDRRFPRLAPKPLSPP